MKAFQTRSKENSTSVSIRTERVTFSYFFFIIFNFHARKMKDSIFIFWTKIIECFEISSNTHTHARACALIVCMQLSRCTSYNFQMLFRCSGICICMFVWVCTAVQYMFTSTKLYTNCNICFAMLCCIWNLFANFRKHDTNSTMPLYTHISKKYIEEVWCSGRKVKKKKMNIWKLYKS